ncbi:MAG TPA: DUF6089 family protein, partial [Chitinophagaceae bacterium]|nr:DUF6089 family protein [Chitinophagaceae bacterium]
MPEAVENRFPGKTASSLINEITALNLLKALINKQFMRKLSIFLFFLLITPFARGQKIHLGLFGGLAAYNGDLTEKIFPKKVTNGSIGLTVNYEFTDQVMFRGGLTYAIVGGADRFSDNPELIKRNLAFETRIFEFSAIGEYYFFNLYDRRYSPYVFAGLAIFRYNPYAFNGTSDKIFLKPLSTEGQGVTGYPDRKPYGLTQPAIPFGGGIKFAVNDNLRIGLELGMRKLFTDYLDDVSTTYIDVNDLLAAKGQLAVDMSYRGDEVPGGDPTYPAKDAQRGGEKSKDYYYFT